MSLSIEDQITSLINQHSNILVCLPANPTTDAIASGLAIHSILQKMGKYSKVVSDGFALPNNHKFLPKSEEIENNLAAAKKFVISLDITDTSVQNLTYDIQGNKLQIYVTPQRGQFDNNSINTSTSQYSYDLIIVLDSRDLNSIGKVFEDNAEFFYHTPILNIDHHPGNEQFGQINVVNVTATSISEIIFELSTNLSGGLLDEFIATNLLTGIISKTKSFKTNDVTPRSLAIASHLISNGARREDIVKHLYQTKSLQSLKLWGRALSKLEVDSEYKIVWSVLKREDFVETDSSPLDLESVIDELIVNTPDAKNIYIVYEQPDERGHMQINAIIYTAPYINGLTEFKDWSAHGSNNFVYASVPHSSLQMAQTLIHDKIRSLVK
ncbi:MAG: DHH family phosphoesterase [bacterium]|nr:DHH family phosphoesterase [bacterium]